MGSSSVSLTHEPRGHLGHAGLLEEEVKAQVPSGCSDVPRTLRPGPGGGGMAGAETTHTSSRVCVKVR